jgi:5-methylcytosine-specific restriction protein A
MPHKALGICREPGCGARCAVGRCAKHAHLAPSKLYDDRRGSAAKRGYGRRHEKWRAMILARDPLCMIQKMCGRSLDRPGEPAHLPAPSTVADHKKPLDPANPLAGDWSLENGQGACKACHDWKTRQEHR